MSKSIMQDEKECYITGSTENLARHHIFYGPYRQASERFGCWCYLRADWHNMSNYGVHFNRDLDLMLKAECQRRFEEIYSHQEFMDTFGRNYL